MKRFITLALALALTTVMLAGCGGTGGEETTAATSQAQEETAVTGKEALAGKKVIFIGNSYTYYGKCVLEKSQDTYSQDQRTNDQGYFYQICKANGIDVTVTNFTFGGHQLMDFYSGSCAANRGHDGLDHLAYLSDRNYDYVILQNGSASKALTNILNECKPLMELFLEGNPNTKFVFLVQDGVHINDYAWRSSIKELESAGVTVVDWGALVNDVVNGTTAVPGAAQEYNKNSFIVNQSASDGFHPNMLTGYITALMTYCAITGESAVGQDYTFCGDETVNSAFNFDKYRVKYYAYDLQTNFDAIFSSSSDMQGLQELIDQYLEAKAYRNY